MEDESRNGIVETQSPKEILVKEIEKRKKVTARELVIILTAILVMLVGYKVMEHKMEKAIADAKSEEPVVIPVDTDIISISNETVREIVEQAKELVGYKYSYMNAGVYEKSKPWFGKFGKIPFTTDKTVYIYEGTIGIGVDLEKMEVDVNNDKKKIEIELPKPEILYHEINENNFQTYDIKNGLVRTSLTDYVEFVKGLKEAQVQKLQNDAAFWDEVQSSMGQTINTLVNSMLMGSEETKEYTIDIRWDK